VVSSDAELVLAQYQIYKQQKHKYGFLSSLGGNFSFVIYDQASDLALAMRSPNASQMLYQGVDMKTGGLVITNALLTNGHELSEIPADHFIFGKFRERHLHAVPRSVAAPSPARAQEQSLNNSKVLALANRIMADNKFNSSKPTPKGLFNFLSNASSPAASGATTPTRSGTTTPSAKGTADRSSTWKRTTPRAFSGLDASSTGSPASTLRTSRVTTTPSAKGTADTQNTWKKAEKPAAGGFQKMDVSTFISFAQEETAYEEELTTMPSPQEVMQKYAVAEMEAGSTVMEALEGLVKNTSRTEGLDGDSVSVSFEQDGSLLLRRSISGRSVDLQAAQPVMLRRSVELFGMRGLSRTSGLTSPTASSRGSLDDVANVLVEREQDSAGTRRSMSSRRGAVAAGLSKAVLQVNPERLSAQATQTIRKSLHERSAMTASSRLSMGQRLSGAF